MDRSKRELPTPVSREDVYLAAILEELEGLRADVKAALAPVPKAVKEFRGDKAPAKSKRKKE